MTNKPNAQQGPMNQKGQKPSSLTSTSPKQNEEKVSSADNAKTDNETDKKADKAEVIRT